MKSLKNTFFVHRGTLLLFLGVYMWLWYLNAIFPTQSDDMGAGFGGLSAAIRSYYSWNGRLGELLRVAFGSYLATTVWYAPINALIGASVLILLFFTVFARLPRLTLKDSSIFLILITFLLVDNSFCFGSVFYWAAGSFNYLWTWLLLLLWMMPYRLYWHHKMENRIGQYENTRVKTVLVSVLGFCAGWSTEFGIVFVFLQLCLIIYQYSIWKRKLPLWYFAGVLSLFAGWLMLYTCPGTAARVAAFQKYGHEYLALSEIIRMPFTDLVRTIIHTYNRVLRWPYYENYVLIAACVCVFSVFDAPFFKKAFQGLGVIIFLGVVLFFLPRVVFLIAAFCVSAMYAYTVRYENKNAARVFLVVACVLFAELVFIGAAIQVNIPRRAGFHYTVLNFLLIAVLMNYFFTIFENNITIKRLACLFCILFSFTMVSFVSTECYIMHLKWQKMEQSIVLQKNNGIRNIVVDKTVFQSRYWGYGDWGNPVEGSGDWVNELYARVYGVDTFQVK